MVVAAGVALAGVATTGAALANAGAGGERAAEAAFTAAHRAAAGTSEGQAVAAAIARHPGTATDVHLEDEGEGLRWEVKPDDGAALWEVQVDAATGAVVSDQPEDGGR